MLKRSGFLFLSLLLVLQVLSFASAQYDGDANEAIGDTIGINPDIIPNPDNVDDIKTNYLKKEWATIIKSKPVIGPIVGFFDSLFTFFSPFFEKVLGVSYSFSWIFVFSLLIWFGFFYFLYPISSQLFGNKAYGALGAFAIASLIGISGVIRKAGDTLSFAVTNLWIAGLCIVIMIFIIILMKKLGLNVKGVIKRSKEEAAKTQTEKDRQVIHSDAKVAGAELDSFKDTGKDI